MTLYDRVADLTVTIESTERTSRRRETSSDFARVTSTFALLAGDEFGAGEDVTYDAVDHEVLPESPVFDLVGEYTVDEFSRMLEEIDLFSTKPPECETSRDYRRWALESAALDLALKQNDTTLAALLGRERSPVRFVASTRLQGGDPKRVEETLAVNPSCEFKLDPTAEWTEETLTRLEETDAVRILDLKGHYEQTEGIQPLAPDRYRQVFETFPDALLEDPAVSDDAWDLLAVNADRLSWDAPIHSVTDLEDRSFDPSWCNIKPSRFGTVRSLFETIEYCDDHGISMYGGGQFELCVGRGHIQLLASLFYPDGPNDVAPRAYNEPDIRTDLLESPLEPPTDPDGLEWARLE